MRSSQNEYASKISSSLVVPHLRNSIGQNHLSHKVQPLPWGDSEGGRYALEEANGLLWPFMWKHMHEIGEYMEVGEKLLEVS